MPRLVSPEELEQLDDAKGATAVIRAALLRRVRLLEAGATEGDCRDLSDLLDLLEQLGQTAPFEVQSLFYLAWEKVGRKDPWLARLAGRMGFEAPLD
jgi:hypothetical protein